MGLRNTILWGALAFSAGVVFGPRLARAADKPAASAAGVDLSGQWTYNQELSDNAHDKMREAMQGRGSGRGAGPGGGGPGGGGMGGPGGGMGGPGGPGMQGGDDPSETMRSVFEPSEQVTITQSETEIVIDEKFGPMRSLHPNGKAYKTQNGTADLKTQWKDGKLVVETKRARGGKLVETWELVPDRSRLVVNVRLDGGSGPPLSLKRVYDRVPEAR